MTAIESSNEGRIVANNDEKKKGSKSKTSPRGEASAQLPIFQRIVNFIRLVIGELKKVKWPTRKELWTYFWVVTIFVLILMVAIFLFDSAFAWVTKYVFT